MEITQDGGVWDLTSNPSQRQIIICIFVPFQSLSLLPECTGNIIFPMKWAFLMLFTDEEAEVSRL